MSMISNRLHPVPAESEEFLIGSSGLREAMAPEISEDQFAFRRYSSL